MLYTFRPIPGLLQYNGNGLQKFWKFENTHLHFHTREWNGEFGTGPMAIISSGILWEAVLKVELRNIF